MAQIEGNNNNFYVRLIINRKIVLVLDICGVMMVLDDQPQGYPQSIANVVAKKRILNLLKSDCCCVMD